MSRPLRTEELTRSLDQPRTAATRRELVRRFGQAAFEAARKQSAIVELLPSVYANYFRTLNPDTRIAAAIKWVLPRGNLTGVAACTLFGSTMPSRFDITIALPGGLIKDRPDWLRVRRLSRPIPVITVQGVPTATLPYALVQAWWDEGPRVARNLIIEAVRETLTSPGEIANAMEAYPQLTRRKELGAFLEILMSGGIDSHLEYLAATTVLNAPDLSHLRKQVELRVGHHAYRVDAFDDRTRTAIEFDGAAYHSSPEAQERDRVRNTELMSIGVATVRLSYADVLNRPEWCRDMIRAAIAARTP